MRTMLSTRREKFNRLVVAASDQPSEWLVSVLKDKARFTALPVSSGNDAAWMRAPYLMNFYRLMLVGAPDDETPDQTETNDGEVCGQCGARTEKIIGCPDGAEICQACFDAGLH